MDKTDGGAGDLLQVERLAADNFVAIIEDRGFIAAGNDGDILVAQEPHRVDGEDGVPMNSVSIEDFQKHGHVGAFG